MPLIPTMSPAGNRQSRPSARRCFAERVSFALLLCLFICTAALAEQKGEWSEPSPRQLYEWAQEAKAAYRAGDFAAAATGGEALLSALRQRLAADDLELANVIHFLATTYQRSARLEEAEPLFVEALAIRRKSLPAAHPDLAASLTDLALLYHDQGRLVEAEPLYREALAIYRAALRSGHPNIALGLNNLALVYRDQGRLSAAEPLYKEALAILRAALPEDDPAIATAVHNLAELYRATGHLAEAQGLYEEALSIRRTALPPDHPLLATSLNSMAELLRAQGRLTEAEPFYLEALSIRRATLRSDHPNIATSLLSLAELYLAQGRVAAAEPLYQESLSIYRAGLPANHPHIAVGLNNLAEFYRITGRFHEARRAFQESLSIYRASLPEDHPGIAAALNNLALVQQALGQFAEAEGLYAQSLSMLHRTLPEDHPQLAESLGNKAWLDFAMRKPLAAASGLWRATEIFTRPANRATLALRAEIFERHALAALFASQTEPEAEPAATPAAAFLSLQWPLLGAAGEALLAGSARRSLGDARLDVVIRRRDSLLADHAATRQLYLAALGSPEAHGGPAGLAELKARYSDFSEALAESEAEMAEAFAGYAALALPQPLTLEATRSLLEPDEALITFLLGDPSIAMVVTRERYAWAFLPDAAELTEKARRLRCQAAISDPACRAAPRSFGTKGGQATRQPLDLVEPDEAHERQPFDLALAHALHQDLLAPFADILTGKNHLIIAPDGRLMGFPFQLLVTEAPKEGLPEEAAYRQAAWLIRHHAISLLPTVSSLKALRELGKDLPTAKRPFVGFGDPVIGEGEAMACPPRERLIASLGEQAAGLRSAAGVTADALFRSGSSAAGVALADVAAVRALARLPDTRCELEAVADALGAGRGDRYLDDMARESQVKALSRQGLLADYRVLLFSTHGLVAGEAGAAEPALVFTPPEVGSLEDDGLLTAGEVAGLKLNADWVILSACNTASGSDPNAEALTGLAKAFFYAGAESLLVSHWPVYSGSTVALVTEIFERLAARPDLSRAEALRQAMLAFLDPARPHLNPHPAYWAPFSLVGEGGVQ